MTDKQPEALRLAGLLELAPEDGVEPQTTEDAAAELRRLHAECEALRDGARAMRSARWYMLNKDGMATLCTSKKDAEKEARAMDMAWPHMGPHRAVQLVEAADVEAMRAGYAAARLEIESLQDRIKTMAEEHADELMVAHLDGRSQAAQQPGTAYAELPSYEHQRAIMEAERNASLDEYSRIVLLTSTESRIYERAFTNGWNRRASHGQAPAQAAPAAVAGPVVNRATVIEWLDANDIEVTDRQMDGLFNSAAPTTQPAPQQEASPTTGMNIAQRILHVGGRNNAAGYVEFGSIQAVEALVRQVLRDLPAAPQPSPASQGDALSQAASDVLAERQRQISAEGWTQSHDDLEHEPGQLSSAAACYALNASEWLTRPYVSRADYATLSFIDLSNWPWDGSWWKPKNERGDLVRAGALILAELERMDRADAARAARAPASSVPPMTAADARRYAEIEADSGASDFAAGIPHAADSVLEDAARLDWLLLHISGAEFRRIGVHYSGNARRADVDAARKQGANHD